MAETKQMHFVVEGAFVTNAAREKLFMDRDMAAALRMLRSCTITDQLNSDEQLMLCLQILHGAASIVGSTRDDTYDVEFRDDIEERPTELSSISQLITDMSAEINMLKEQVQDMTDKVSFLANHISDKLGTFALERVNAEYYNTTGIPLFEGIRIPEWMKEKNQYLDFNLNNMLDSFLEQRRLEDKAAQRGEEVCDYGWLAPDGTFYPVEWGKHAEWAGEWLQENMPYAENPEIYTYMDKDGCSHAISGSDVLIYSLNWILLDSPFQGIAKATRNPDKNMTKAQKEFLYDYYTERNRNDEANALYEE